ncbi:hypothetical protein Vafri_21879 [Volvox africanus]|uniref:Uncharacterized protein n=1 Tax=Volvox africanus TaxID=51714 RepID=A0A8J4FED8_9CHLO|nr:hypothetical protein Vafri_21879 [Volvox africanus]
MPDIPGRRATLWLPVLAAAAVAADPPLTAAAAEVLTLSEDENEELNVEVAGQLLKQSHLHPCCRQQPLQRSREGRQHRRYRRSGGGASLQRGIQPCPHGSDVRHASCSESSRRSGVLAWGRAERERWIAEEQSLAAEAVLREHNEAAAALAAELARLRASYGGASYSEGGATADAAAMSAGVLLADERATEAAARLRRCEWREARMALAARRRLLWQGNQAEELAQLLFYRSG